LPVFERSAANLSRRRVKLFYAAKGLSSRDPCRFKALAERKAAVSRKKVGATKVKKDDKNLSSCVKQKNKQ